ncbi:MAG: ROK family transcriptional regulator [Lactimicrobium sp.]|uniref:ROK family transcriptional regulator n=1 Tax=Lactimicrobium sp. TaxID=2563780 RepID=UPI002F35E9C6
MRNGMNMSGLKLNNRAAVLSIINAQGPISRIDIARQTGLTAASLTQITAPLLKEGLLVETGKQELSAAGRRKVLLQLNENYQLPLCVNIDREQTVMTICSLKGMVIAQKRMHTSLEDPESFLKQTAAEIRKLIASLPEKKQREIKGISVGIAGALDREQGISKKEGGLFGKDIPIQSILQNETGLPVILENNVDAFAQAELLFGSGRKENNLLVIKWGPGVGSAVIIHGELYEGKGRQAELGHILYPDGTDLEEHISTAALKNKSQKELENAAKELAVAIVNACMVLSPDHVILYGSLACRDDNAQRAMNAVKAMDPDLAIQVSSLTAQEDWIGECAVYLRQKIF